MDAYKTLGYVCLFGGILAMIGCALLPILDLMRSGKDKGGDKEEGEA